MPPGVPKLIFSLPGGETTTCDAPADRLEIGRGEGRDITLAHGSVSDPHAAIERADGGWVIRDLGSTNGIEDRGRRDEVFELTDGLVLELGEAKLEVRVVGPPPGPKRQTRGGAGAAAAPGGTPAAPEPGAGAGAQIAALRRRRQRRGALGLLVGGAVVAGIAYLLGVLVRVLTG